MTTIRELIELLEKDYPDKATLIKDKSHDEQVAYFAKLELIDHIKLITTPNKGR